MPLRFVPLLALALLAPPALAQTLPDAAPAMPGSRPGALPEAGDAAAPGARRSPRAAAPAISPASTRKPDARKPDARDLAARKAQETAQARDKAWDSRMKRTLVSICKGC